MYSDFTVVIYTDTQTLRFVSCAAWNERTSDQSLKLCILQQILSVDDIMKKLRTSRDTSIMCKKIIMRA